MTAMAGSTRLGILLLHLQVSSSLRSQPLLPQSRQHARAAAPIAVLGELQALEGFPLLFHNGQAAFAASAAATVAFHPLDTLKSRLQSDNYRLSRAQPARLFRRRCSSPEECALEEEETVRGEQARVVLSVGGPPDASQRLGNRQRLFEGLYSGLGANVLKEAPDAAVYLAVCEQLSHSLVANPWFASHWGFTLVPVARVEPTRPLSRPHLEDTRKCTAEQSSE